MPKTCSKCGGQFKGFGDVCSDCRRVTKKEGDTHTCEACGVIFMGFGTKCDDCKSVTVSDDHCAECFRVAYPMERIVIRGQCFHRACFKCSECSTTLSSADYYKSKTGKYFCRTHFERLPEFRGTLHIPTGDPQQERDEDDEDDSQDSRPPMLKLSSFHMGLNLGLCGALGARGQAKLVEPEGVRGAGPCTGWAPAGCTCAARAVGP